MATNLQLHRPVLAIIHKFLLRSSRIVLRVALGCLCSCMPGIAQQQGSLTLHDALVSARQSALAREGDDRVAAAKGLVVQAGLRPNPKLYLQAEDLRPGASDFDFANQTEEYAYLGQSVELGGKRGRRVDFAKASVQQVQAERELLLQQVTGRVAAAYWTAIASERIATVLQTDMKTVEEIVRYNKERVSAGAMAGVDLLRVQIERDRLLLALETARREAEMARLSLFREMGVPAQPNVSLSGSLDSFEPVKPESVEAVLAGRADVAVARQAVSVAEADVKLQRSLGVPDLDLLGGYKRNNGLNTGYTGLNIPLAFRNRNQGEVERAQANVQLARDSLRQLELVVTAEVKTAQESYEAQQAAIHSILPDMRLRAKQNLAIMDDAYRTGGVDLLRYLDAERTEFDIEVSALKALAEFQQAGVRLQLAYGVQP